MADLPNCPASREEAYLASIAGEGVEVPPCPRSRKEAYLDAIDGKMDDIEQEIEDLKNNPDVVDIVDTYADLQAYDTSALTDKDVIRVLNDETHDGNSTFYRWNAATSSFDYIGEAGSSVDVFVGTDGIEPGEKGLVPAPAITDVNKFLKGNGNWEEIDASLPTLTTADYNYPTNNPTSVAIWLLNSGVYKIGTDNLKIARWESPSSSIVSSPINAILIIGAPAAGVKSALMIGGTFESGLSSGAIYWETAENGYRQTEAGYILTTNLTIDNLTNTSTARPLSANQGKVLKDLIDSLAIKNAGAPTTSTVGTVGMLLEDTTNGKLYQLTAIDITDPQNPSYTWTEVGGSSVNVVQTTGTSTTDVMSQDAVTSMVYADPSNLNVSSVKLGNVSALSSAGCFAYRGSIGANSIESFCFDGEVEANSPRGIAIGQNARVGTGQVGYGAGAIALGAYSRATLKGQMDIGSTSSAYGYNSSNYRLLTGLYDPQSDHDAATKGYVDAHSATLLTNTEFNSILENA